MALLVLVPALLLSVSSGAPTVPSDVLCLDGECADGAVHLLQASKEPLRAGGAGAKNGESLVTGADLADVPSQPYEAVLLQSNATLTYWVSNMADWTSAQIELELSTTTVPQKNKVILAIVELLGLGLCGIDRCFMGQVWVGILKGLTLGGFVVWALLDYVAVLVSCLCSMHSINFLGLRADFTNVKATFILTLTLVIIKVVASFYHFRHRGSAKSTAFAPKP
mmetsp:Transcript_782/g.2128  ORF Transcript_782/g.2128 Transcript_782/m.2128 type:complete len:223 (+) Transcript_782:78-746(+)